MKAQTMNRKATLKTLYRLSKGVDKYFDLFRQLSHGKTVRWLLAAEKLPTHQNEDDAASAAEFSF